MAVAVIIAQNVVFWADNDWANWHLTNNGAGAVVVVSTILHIPANGISVVELCTGGEFCFCAVPALINVTFASLFKL